jgi:hypothetical protein
MEERVYRRKYMEKKVDEDKMLEKGVGREEENTRGGG